MFSCCWTRQITRDPSETQPAGSLSTCVTQLVGELLGEQTYSAFTDMTVGFAIQGTKVGVHHASDIHIYVLLEDREYVKYQNSHSTPTMF